MVNEDDDWKTLYTLGAWAAIAVVVLVPIQVAIFAIWPPPTTVSDYFSTFHNNPIIGLLNQDLLLLIDMVLMMLVTVALYVALRRANPSVMVLALVGMVIGTGLLLASNTAFDMLNLSSKYAAATSDQQKAALLAAGEAVLARYQGTPYVVGYLLSGLSALLIAIVMLHSAAFGKVTAYVGIVFGIASLVPPLGIIGMVFAFASLLPMLAWLILIARRLFRLNRGVEPANGVRATGSRRVAT